MSILVWTLSFDFLWIGMNLLPLDGYKKAPTTVSNKNKGWGEFWYDFRGH